MEQKKPKAEKATIILHSGDMDKLYSALIIGNGALAMGMAASVFFTFWGLQRLRKNSAISLPKGGLEKGPLSKMHMLGLGKLMIEQRMDKANVASLERLMADFKELGGKIIACDMTAGAMEIMGVRREDLREELIDEYGAVGTYIQEAHGSAITLFI
ncbi:MAG: DsrE/DsrF/DrsH-like family protein [Anaerolineae bacterium]